MRVHGARAILELGTLGGYSTIWLGRGLASGGRIVTLEADAHYAEVARANLARARARRGGRGAHRSRGTTLARLAADGEGPFDLVFIDADKAGNAQYLAGRSRSRARAR